MLLQLIQLPALPQLLAQTTDVTTGIDPLLINLTSLGSVIFVATLIVQRVVKPLCGRFPTTLGQLPTMAYLIPIACGLTYVANRFMFTLPGDNVLRLIRDTVVSILMSQGFYTIPEALRPIRDTKSAGVLMKKDDAPSVAQQGQADMAAEADKAIEALRANQAHRPLRSGDPVPQTYPDPNDPNPSRTLDPNDPNSFQKIPPFPSILFLLLIPLFAIVAAGCAPTSDAFYNGMKSQWPPVRDTYSRYVSNDPTLSPIERSIELDSARNIDRLLAAEAQRRAATQPSPAVNVNQPALVGH